ncbi:DUF881 domain-containing protein [Streptomyces alkaliphilus]|uniref:DUF881 domain-containing protein n=1 Tax=Streptomyces alkaliphilus TaxID=1472722 RepID=UPI00117C249F|nr:DUF881 domain-containing protein [Streptomyces alkaliphilus]MQS07072.1 DUF881 domain-containing protein [Streptomyces alkaliphilus]
MPAQSSRPPDATSRPDASMWLLNQVMDHSLDEGYEEAAARRAAAGGNHPRTLRDRVWLAVGLLLAAFVVTAGAAQARAGAPEVAREREELLERVRAGTEGADRLQAEVDGLRDAVAEGRRAALTEEGGERAELVGLLAGAIAVTGPGLELVVDDAEGAGTGSGAGPREGSGFSDTGRVRDRDLQRVVNGLWAAGAEAVAINDRRLTSLSAIRTAGDAVLVDNRPLVPPYTVQAIGDGEALREAFEAGPAGATLRDLRDHFGIRVTTGVRDELRLPAATGATTRYAVPVDPDAAPGDTGTRETDHDTEEDYTP